MEMSSKPGNQDLFIIIEGEKIELENSIAKEINKKLPVTLPQSINKNHFSLFCTICSTTKANFQDHEALCKAFEIFTILQHSQCEKIAQDIIIPKLNKKSSLIFFDEAVNQQKSENQAAWKDIYEDCLAKIDEYILSYTKNDFSKLSAESIEVLIAIYYTQPTASSLILALKNKREALGILDLLAKEQLASVNSKLSYDVDFIWNLPKEKSNNYLESASFSLDFLKFSLILIKFPNENRCELYLQLSRNNEEQRIMTISYCLQIADKSSFETLNFTSGPNSQFLITSFAYESINYLPDTKIALRIEKTSTAILNYIAKNPNETLLIEDLTLLSRSQLSLLLKFKHLKLSNEDDALELVGRYIQENKISDDSLSDLLSPLKWEFITLNSLFKAAFTYEALKESQYFIQKFKQELLIKGSGEARKHKDKPRHSYDKKNKEDSEIFDELCSCIFSNCEEPAIRESEIIYLSDMIGQKEQELQNLKGSYHSHSLTIGTSTPDSMQTKLHDEISDFPEFPQISPIRKPLKVASPLNPIPEFIPQAKTDTQDAAILSLLNKLEML